MKMHDTIVLRVPKNERYKIISTLASEDPTLSWKAKGLHTYLVSRPDGWKVNQAGLIASSSDGAASTKGAIRELKRAGYVKIEPMREKGRIAGWRWTVWEEKQTT